MAYSIQTAVSDGTLAVLDLSISYMDKSHIQVYVDDVLADGSAYSYVWLTDTRIQIVPAVANGSTLKVLRKTLTDEMWHEFTQGARFSTTSMDENFEQLLFLAQEYAEGIYVSDFYTDLDMHLHKVLNLADPTNDGDAVNFKTLKDFLPYGEAAAGLVTRITAEETKSAQLDAQGITSNSKTITGFVATGIPNGAWLHFAGRDTLGDGGGGFCWYSSTSTQPADGITVFTPAVGSGRIFREGWTVLGFNKPIPFAWGGATGSGDETAKLQAVLDYAIAKGNTLDISGNYSVTALSLNGANGLRVTGRGSIVGIATTPTPALLTMKNVVNIAIDGAWFVNGNYNTNYEDGVWAYTDSAGQQAAYLDFTNLSVVNCKRAYKFGNDSRPDDLVSEINVRGGHTYGCPSVIEAVGAQTVINISNATLASLVGSGNAAWQALPQKTVVARGASVQITGGELLHVLTSTGGLSAAFNTLCEIQTIASVGSGNIYGNITVTGTLVETACRLVSTSNPLNLPLPLAGAVGFTGCHGVSTQDTSPFIETDSTFVGRMRFKSNNFFATSLRTNATIYANANCDIYCDDESFGKNFIPWVQGTVGGVIHFPSQMVLNVSNLNSQALTTATLVPLKYTAVVNAGSLARFAGNYNASTGEFTVPAGGLKNVRIEAQLLCAGLGGEWYVQINGVSYGVRTLGLYNTNSYSIDSLNAGDKVRVVVLNTNASVNAQASATDWFQIFASN